MPEISIILPAKNESLGLKQLLPDLKALHAEAEIIVVNDASRDDTIEVCKQNKTKVVNQPYTMGNGAAVKAGARAASGNILVFMDADGQHEAKDISKLLEELEKGFDMVVGARSTNSHRPVFRRFANAAYNWLASMMTGYKIQDLTSGFRAVRARKFRKFLYLLPNGFSYPTTITMAFFRSGFPIAYVPVEMKQRIGKSKIRIFRDGLRFLIIILKIGALFSPMRLFLPISSMLFILGAGYYIYTYFFQGRFTNMGAVLFLSALIIFLVGIVSEQISALHYRNTSDDGS